MELLRKHMPIVLLTLWVALCFFCPIPWATDEVQQVARENRLQQRAWGWRESLERRLEHFQIAEREEVLIKSLCLADRRCLTLDQREAFADAGAMHVLAVSGLHVGIVHQVLFFLLSLGGLLYIPWEKRWAHNLQRVLALAGVWFYALITGLTTSVVRSALMISLLPSGKRHMMSNMNFNRLSTAALLILLVNPTALYTPSFLLSFSAVAAILFFVPRWNELLTLPRKWRFISDLIVVSLAAQIGTLPWTLYFFGQSANYFLLTNLFVLPLASVLLSCTFATLACSFVPFLAPVARLLAWISEKTAWLMNEGVALVQSLPGSTTFITWNGQLTLLLVLLIVVLTLSQTFLIKKKQIAGAICFFIAVLLVAVMLCLYYFTVSSRV